MVTCPACGHRASWKPSAQPLEVRCVAVRLTRQIRRQAEREGRAPESLGTPCNAQFRVLAVAA